MAAIGGDVIAVNVKPVLEFLNYLWGLGTE